LLANNHLIADFDNPASEPLQFSPAYASDHTVFGFAQTTVVKSTDGGDTWQEIGLPPAAAMLQPPLVTTPAGAAHHREGDTAHKLMIPIDLEHPYSAPVTVQWRTVDVPGNPNWATSGSDYVAATGTLTYPVGATRQYIAVTVTNDSVHEPSESVLVALGATTNAKIGVPLGLVAGVIDDDDAAPAR
jgi:hypothetical protein